MQRKIATGSATPARRLMCLAMVAPLLLISRSGTTAPNQAAAPLALNALKTGGAQDDATLNAIYNGDFEKVDFEKASVMLKGLINGYIDGYSAQCYAKFPSGSPPPGTIEVTETVCDTERQEFNQYGLARTTCVASHQRDTGVFADRDLYQASILSELTQLGGTLKEMFDRLREGASMKLLADASRYNREGAALTGQNGCASPALRRFKENLTRFTLGQNGVRPDGTIALPKPKEENLYDLTTPVFFARMNKFARESMSPADANLLADILAEFVRLDQDPNTIQQQIVDQNERLTPLYARYQNGCDHGTQKTCEAAKVMQQVNIREGDLYQQASVKDIARRRAQRGTPYRPGYRNR